MLAAVISVPWQSIVGLMGLLGLVYVIIVAPRMKSLFAGVRRSIVSRCASVPGIHADHSLRIGLSGRSGRRALGDGSRRAARSFVGNHNAWDAVTYRVFQLNRIGREAPAN